MSDTVTSVVIDNGAHQMDLRYNQSTIINITIVSKVKLTYIVAAKFSNSDVHDNDVNTVIRYQVL